MPSPAWPSNNSRFINAPQPTFLKLDPTTDIRGVGYLFCRLEGRGGLGIISLLIGAVGIFSSMIIAQQARIPEVGLLMSMGCPLRRILLLLLLEAMVLAVLVDPVVALRGKRPCSGVTAYIRSQELDMTEPPHGWLRFI